MSVRLVGLTIGGRMVRLVASIHAHCAVISCLIAVRLNAKVIVFFIVYLNCVFVFILFGISVLDFIEAFVAVVMRQIKTTCSFLGEHARQSMPHAQVRS